MRPKRGQEVATRLNELLNSPVSQKPIKFPIIQTEIAYFVPNGQ